METDKDGYRYKKVCITWEIRRWIFIANAKRENGCYFSISKIEKDQTQESCRVETILIINGN